MSNHRKVAAKDALLQMLKRYDLNNLQDHRHAIKEIVQEIALLGLWRAKFFEHAAFYGGTALRILHGLDRFSEDLDFTLLKPNKSFKIADYKKAIESELESLGFSAQIEVKKKTKQSAINSAFIKMNTIEHLLLIGLPKELEKGINKNELIKIRFEVDTDPPDDGAVTESKLLLLPFPFYIKTLRLEDLFAGKLHAAICREWKGRVKGRDWYDLIWFITRNIKLNLTALEARMRQTKHWTSEAKLSKENLLKIFDDKVDNLDLKSAKEDIITFISDEAQVEIWSKDFLKQVFRQTQYLS